MATLTYDVYTGVLVAQSDKNLALRIFATGASGGANYYEFGRVRQVGKHGTKNHVHGGPIPVGKWPILKPGSPHPDGGALRPKWIPVGPVSHRTHIYIHPKGTLTEGCIAVDDPVRFFEIRQLLNNENGGTLFVIPGRTDVLV